MVSCAPFRNQVTEQGVGGEKWAETKNAVVPKILCEVNALFFFFFETQYYQPRITSRGPNH